MSEPQAKQPISGLRIVLILIAILGTIGIIGSSIFAWIYFTQISPIDPAQSDKMAQSIARIDKLPPGFERTLVMKMSIVDYVEYRNTRKRMVIKLIKQTNSYSSNRSAEDIVSRHPHTGKLTSSGTRTVAGEHMAYDIEYADFVKSSRLIGAIVVKNTPIVIEIDAMTAFSPNFDMKQLDAFLDSIKGFGDGKEQPPL